jgi:hypothetical protein
MAAASSIRGSMTPTFTAVSSPLGYMMKADTSDLDDISNAGSSNGLENISPTGEKPILNLYLVNINQENQGLRKIPTEIFQAKHCVR